MLSRNIRIAVVGSGPAGFFISGNFLKHPNTRIDMFEKVPMPFGLLRYGVAPDNVDVRNVASKFEKILENPNFSFNGNVHVGKDLNLADLSSAYNVVIMATGAEIARELPNFKFQNLNAHDFMRWVNGHPHVGDSMRETLNGTEQVVVIGAGNAALDVARVLLTAGTDYLDKFNHLIPIHVLNVLHSLKIRKVRLIARRDAVHSAFSTREFRHCTRLFPVRVENVDTRVTYQNLSRADKRKMELVMSCAGPRETDCRREMVVSYLRRPLKLVNKSLILGVNEVTYDNVSKIIQSDREELCDCDQIITSLGSDSDFKCDHYNVFYCGWSRTGSLGTIHETLVDSNSLISELMENYMILLEGRKPGMEAPEISNKLKNMAVVSKEGWRKVRNYEKLENVRLSHFSEIMRVINL